MSRISGTHAGRAGEGGLRLLLLVFLIFAAFLGCGPSLAAQAAKGAANTNSSEEFFIISSVDSEKRQLLLKLPSEITELLQVNDKTRYTDKNGKVMQFADLRAGDTVYIRSAVTPTGKLAVSVHKGPMTVEELHRHYLK
jgi:hypothetical protein